MDKTWSEKKVAKDHGKKYQVTNEVHCDFVKLHFHSAIKNSVKKINLVHVGSLLNLVSMLPIYSHLDADLIWSFNEVKTTNYNYKKSATMMLNMNAYF